MNNVSSMYDITLKKYLRQKILELEIRQNRVAFDRDNATGEYNAITNILEQFKHDLHELEASGGSFDE